MSFQPIENVFRQEGTICMIRTIIRENYDPEITALYVKDEADTLKILKEEEKQFNLSSSYSKIETDYNSGSEAIIRTIQIYVCYSDDTYIQHKLFYTIASHSPISKEIYEKIDDIVRDWNIYQ